ncbi:MULTISPECIES: amidase [Falsihalocynthiibacter]|uniref:amidase n=1 Tax=Falsihalocynthiibacter TaxID=2854182 RepID=UPI00300348C1
MSIWKLDITDLLAGYADGSITPTQAVACLQERIAALNQTLNAYTAINPDALIQAAASTQRWQNGTPLGLLDGVPLIIKDNLVTAGMPASWGNAYLSKLACTHDEAPIAKLRAAGAIFLGKGNTPEFAVEGYTDNLTFGVTRNPFDPALTPGGSSGGVVAAVAAGMAAAGIGTDGGGSIRRPAGYTGLLGLKPGIGHVGRRGGLAQVLLDFEVVGPIARSARDLALLDMVLADTPCPPTPLKSMRILAVEALGESPCDPTIREAFNDTCERLAALGHPVTRAQLPIDLRALNAVWSQIGAIGLANYFTQAPEVRASANPKYLEMAQAGASKTATDLYQIMEIVFALRNELAALFAAYDIVLTPTAAANPWPASEPFPTEIDGHTVGPRGHAVFTGWVNAAGLPAVAFPAASEGLPIGMQLIGQHGSEALLTDLASTCVAPFRWPALAATPT